MCGCALEDVKGNGTDRSVSPTSPLDCFESHPVTEAFDEAVVLEEGQDRSVAVHYLEDLPTPRGCACPDGTTTEVDPDLNNDFSDLYDSTRRIAEDQHNNPDSLITVETVHLKTQQILFCFRDSNQKCIDQQVLSIMLNAILIWRMI